MSFKKTTNMHECFELGSNLHPQRKYLGRISLILNVYHETNLLVLHTKRNLI
ncbi:hypothetical protein Mapa_012905 [Marchantia paleacea]|nr:hypothetical protein Mapa_012905 [Marchantia paleacea]